MKASTLVIALALLISPALLRAEEPRVPLAQIEAIDRQISITLKSIESIKRMPVEFAGALVLMGTDSQEANPTRENVLELLSVRQEKLATQLAAARKQLATIEAMETNVPVESMELVKAMEYVATEKVDLSQRLIADTQLDINYTKGGNNGGGQVLVDRKLALLKRTAAFLGKQRLLFLGQDPRPASK